MNTFFLVGPTAVGKTAVALELATRLDAEIVSADSMQVYRGMDIGTAKPTPSELARVRHHLIDVVGVTERFDVQQFVRLAESAIAGIHARGRLALVVGGTGLYVRALRQGLFVGPGRDAQLRDRLERLSAPELFAELAAVDPETAARIDPHNTRRLVRALEVWYATGRSIGEWQTQWTTDPSVPVLGLERNRADLVGRIERRIEAQLAAGWLDEVRELLEQGLAANATAMQAAGYQELTAVVRGERELTVAVALIKARTRQLAKRQMTWFRREPGLVWQMVSRDEPPAITAARALEWWKRVR